MNESYKAAGVDVHAGYKAVELMKSHVKKTHIDGVLSDIGGFGGLFEIGKGYENPVLVSGTDGVGTKLKLAFLMNKHTTIGQDCVAMCVNDIVCSGAKPLFFLDYIAVGKNYPEKVADIVSGVADGCCKAGCALIGGETAEMPGFYSEDEYDLAGFAVGIVDKNKIIDSSKIQEGNVLIGIGSSGVHSNGFSLVRKIFDLDGEKKANCLFETPEGFDVTLGEALLMPTKIYVKQLLALIDKFDILGISHITGGGFYENIPRMLPKGLSAEVNTSSYELPVLFSYIMKYGNIPARDMYNTFNMGVGIVLAAPKEQAESIVSELTQMGEKAFVLGKVVKSDEGVIIK